MSKRSDIELLNDIKEAIRRIKEYINGIDYSKFLKDLLIQDAVIRNIEIIGEATKNLSTKIKDKYSNVEWKKISGSRDRLIHEYFGVNYDIVWAIAKEELPGFVKEIDLIIKEASKN